MTKQLDHVSPGTERQLRTHEGTQDPSRVPNFVHVGENAYALEGYLRLYFREWMESARRCSTH